MDYLSEKEDKKFSQMVIECNNCNNTEEKERRMVAVRERTKILIYRVSKEILHMTEDEASTIFLDMNEDLDSIISSYRVCSSSYNIYLRQLCLYRGRRLRRNEVKSSIWENAFFMDGISITNEFNENYDYFGLESDSKDLPPTKNLTSFRKMSMTQLINYIVKNKEPRHYPLYNDKEKELKKFLSFNYINRKRFLIFILAMPINTKEVDSLDLARVLQVEEGAIMVLLEMKEEHTYWSKAKQESALSIANKHWRVMKRIELSIATEPNLKERQAMQEHYQRIAKCHSKQLRLAEKAKRGMARAKIAQTLNISQSSVTEAIRQIMIVLKHISST